MTTSANRPRPGAGSGLLNGRCAVVTGGARGIGLEIAYRFAAEGASVAIADLDEKAVSVAAADVASHTGAPTLGVRMDVADAASVGAAADRIERQMGVCDVIVPNAGILVLAAALDITDEQFRRVMQINLVGSFATAAEFGRRLVASRRPGSIIFTSSLFGLRGGAGNAAYSASKFGIVGLAQSMAADLAPQHIRVNSVCPGQIDSVMLQQLFNDRAAESGRTNLHEQEIFESRIPLRRLGTATEVADAFVYLASSLSSYVTGHSLVVDGGWSVS